jgi:hypothetical protein
LLNIRASILLVKGKGKVVPVFNSALHLQDVWGSGCIDSCILDLSTSWRRVVRFMPWLLYPWGKSLQYPLNRRLSGPQNMSE